MAKAQRTSSAKPSTHTAFPANESWFYDPVTFYVSNQDGEPVAQLRPTPPIRPSEERLLRTAGQLIAAAPDLLHACFEVVAAWEHGSLSDAARMCQAAVWRAQGRPSAQRLPASTAA